VSELTLSAAPAPAPPGTAGTGTSGGAGNAAFAPGAADRTRPNGGSPAEATAGGGRPLNPFAALLSGVLQGTQPLAPVADSLPADSTLPTAELLTAAQADSSRVLALPVTGVSPAPVPDASSITESGSLYGSALPPTGKSLPPEVRGVPGDRSAATAPATNAPAAPAPEPDPTTLRVTTRPGVSLADLAYSRQLAEVPGLATANPPDGIRSTAAMAFAAHALAATRKAGSLNAPLERLAPLQELDLAAIRTTGTDAPLPLNGTDGAVLRQSVADLFRTPVIQGAGAELGGRQLAAFAMADDRGSTDLSRASTGAPGTAGSGSAALLNRPGSAALPGLQPLGDASAFSAGLADRLLMLGGPGSHTARLKLYPEHLGELKIDIRIDDGSAEVRFGTTTAQAREAIEGSLPRLRELFADQGIQLTRTQVDAGTGQMGHPGSETRQPMTGDWPAPSDSGGRPAAGATAVPGMGAPATTSRLLDVWA